MDLSLRDVFEGFIKLYDASYYSQADALSELDQVCARLESHEDCQPAKIMETVSEVLNKLDFIEREFSRELRSSSGQNVQELRSIACYKLDHALDQSDPISASKIHQSSLKSPSLTSKKVSKIIKKIFTRNEMENIYADLISIKVLMNSVTGGTSHEATLHFESELNQIESILKRYGSNKQFSMADLERLHALLGTHRDFVEKTHNEIMLDEEIYLPEISYEFFGEMRSQSYEAWSQIFVLPYLKRVDTLIDHIQTSIN